MELQYADYWLVWVDICYEGRGDYSLNISCCCFCVASASGMEGSDLKYLCCRRVVRRLGLGLGRAPHNIWR